MYSISLNSLQFLKTGVGSLKAFKMLREYTQVHIGPIFKSGVRFPGSFWKLKLNSKAIDEYLKGNLTIFYRDILNGPS